MYQDLPHQLRFTEVLPRTSLALKLINLSVRQIRFNRRWLFMLMADTSVTGKLRIMDSSTATPSAEAANSFVDQVVGPVGTT